MTITDGELQRLELERLQNRIMRLESIIKNLRRYVIRVEAETSEILAHSSGVPRGKWSFAKGAFKVVGDVKNLLERGLLC